MNEYDIYDAVEIIRSNRKTFSIQIRPDLSIIMRVPNRATKTQILRILREKQDWIISHTEQMESRKEAAGNLTPFTREELQLMVRKSKEILPQRTAYFAQQLGVTYGRISIRSQKTRWGSCSNDGNLNFNCLLMQTPQDIIDYVVVHELCHRKEMNHSKLFWSHVESILPDYRIRKKWLKENGGSLIARLPS